MRNVEIDLETLGTVPGSIILSIGAVLFDPATGALGKEFYCVISKQSSEFFGMTHSVSTLEWWTKQSPEARKVLTEAEADDAAYMDVALERLTAFIPKGAKVWSNGANFDQPLLAVAYDRIGGTVPWEFWNGRCHRTLVALCPNEKALRPATVCAHNALEDAKWQARHLCNVVKAMGWKL